MNNMTQENIKYDDYNEDMERAIALNSDETLLDTQAWKENNIQQFLEEENKKTLRFVKMLVKTGDKQQLENGWLQEHNTRLINFILSEVEKEVEQAKRYDFGGYPDDRYMEEEFDGEYMNYKDISTIINNLRVK